MRSLSAAQLAAQTAASISPAVIVSIGGVAYSSEDGDLLYSVEHIEEPLASSATIALKVGETGISPATQSPLGQTFAAHYTLGEEVIISYGFAGLPLMETAPLRTVAYRFTSRPGFGLLEFKCIGMWELFKGTRIVKDPTDEGSAPPFYEGDTTIYDILKEIIEGTATFNPGRGTLFLDETDGIIDIYKPHYEVAPQEDGRTTIRNLLDMTECYIRVRPDGFHIVHPVQGDAVDYSYELPAGGSVAGTHSFYVRTQEGRLNIPNRVVVVDRLPGGDPLLGGEVPLYQGLAEEPFSVAKIGYMDLITSSDMIESEAEANLLANLFMNKLKGGAFVEETLAGGFVGEIIAPMNIGQELFDVVQFVDNRVISTVKGRVSRVARVWRMGDYHIELRTGNLAPHLGIKIDWQTNLPGEEGVPIEVGTPQPPIEREYPGGPVTGGGEPEVPPDIEVGPPSGVIEA